MFVADIHNVFSLALVIFSLLSSQLYIKNVNYFVCVCVCVCVCVGGCVGVCVYVCARARVCVIPHEAHSHVPTEHNQKIISIFDISPEIWTTLKALPSTFRGHCPRAFLMAKL